MNFLLKSAFVYNGDDFSVGDVFISDGLISNGCEAVCTPDMIFDFKGKYVFPGFTDVHVHLREPGFSYKETIASGCAAAAHGGFTTICAMPNLNPVPDCREKLDIELAAIAAGAMVNVLPYAAITVGSRGEKLAALGELGDAFAFTDDGHGTTTQMLTEAMKIAKSMGKVVCSHCEDVGIKGGDHIASGAPYCKTLGITGISDESEYVQLERELEAVAKTGAKYHLCHLSCRRSVELIRQAKASGLDVTCETAPHYIALDYTMIDSDDGKYKMNPPLRSPADREAVLEGLRDGTIDMIATDHAPHSAEEKGHGLRGSLMGVVGLETSFAVCYTALVRGGMLTLGRLIELMSTAPRRRFGLTPTVLAPGSPAELTAFDLVSEYKVTPGDFYSKGRSTPFEGHKLWSECLLTVCSGHIVYKK